MGNSSQKKHILNDLNLKNCNVKYSTTHPGNSLPYSVIVPDSLHLETLVLSNGCLRAISSAKAAYPPPSLTAMASILQDGTP